MVAVAMDVQGAKPAKPYVKLANAEYTTVVDSENVLAALLGLTIVPNVHRIDEAGIFRGEAEDQAAVAEWVEGGNTPALVGAVATDNTTPRRALEALAAWLPENAELHLDLADVRREAGDLDDAESAYKLALELGETPLTRFRYASLLLELGRRDEAIEHLRKAAKMDPDDYVIRKQPWAVETPGAFYDGSVDHDWQAEQMRTEDAGN